MENTLLKFSTEPEYFVNLDKNTVIEVYSFDSSALTDLFRVGDSYIGFADFRFELHRGNTDNVVHNIFITFPNVEKSKVKQIAEYFESTEEQLAELEAMDTVTLLFSIREEVLKEIIQPYYDNPNKSLKLFELLDNDDEPVLLNFKYYKPEDVEKA